MQAIILAAGYGRRMQPLTAASHKALLPVGDTTILARIVDALLAAGVRGILVVTGYRAEDVRAYLAARYPDVAFEFVHNDRFDTTNNIVSLSLALDRSPLDRDVLLVECDLLFDPALVAGLVARGRGNVALVDRYRPGMDGTVVAVDNGVITHVYPPHLQGRDFVYGDKFKTLNIYRFDGEFCRGVLQPLLNCYANLIDGNCYYELVLGMLVNMQRQRIDAAIVDGASWAEVDDPNDLAVARFTFEPARRAEVLDRTRGGLWNFGVLDFGYMANAYFPTDAMLAAFRQALPDLLKCYGSTQAVLNEKLAYAMRCAADRVQVLHGASQIFPLLPRLLGDRPVTIPAPTFGEYPRMFPAAATYSDAPGYDLERAVASVPRGGVFVVVTPNSPTGTTVPGERILAAAASRRDATFVVDESFVEFSGEPSIVERLEREARPNVVVVRSLSKSLGVPGLRLGFAYSANPAFVRALGAELPIWNLGAPAEYLLELLLKFRTELDVSIQRTIDDRAALAAALAGLSIVEHVYQSGGNFLLVRLAGDASLGARLRHALLAGHRIDIKDVSDRFDGRRAYVRIAVRSRADNAALLDAVSALCAVLPLRA